MSKKVCRLLKKALPDNVDKARWRKIKRDYKRRNPDQKTWILRIIRTMG